ncbi:hypothetical protein LPB41_27970 [Thalassospira sp. MA62]|nr:hypothetical protein [Thalassospira sp. MA62]
MRIKILHEINRKGQTVTYRGTWVGGMIAGLVMTVAHIASAQQGGAFDPIPADQSPITYAARVEGQSAFLRQYRENSTVFVGRWYAPRTADEAPSTASALYMETVYTTSAAGFRFSTAMEPAALVDMFAALKAGASINGRAFMQETRFGPMNLAPFAKDNAQCIAFVGQWDPQTPSQRGSRLLGYYCKPPQLLDTGIQVNPGQNISTFDAQEFAAGFFGRLTVTLPENSPPIPGSQDASNSDNEQPAGVVEPSASNDGIDIASNWQGVRGTGSLRFDQPAGQGTMILDDDQRHCEGIWRHEGGSYQSDPLPFGSWYIYCNDSSFARGNYVSENASSVRGEGQDNQGQAVYFREQR